MLQWQIEGAYVWHLYLIFAAVWLIGALMLWLLSRADRHLYEGLAYRESKRREPNQGTIDDYTRTAKERGKRMSTFSRGALLFPVWPLVVVGLIVWFLGPIVFDFVDSVRGRT